MKFIRLGLVLIMLACLVFSAGCIPVVPEAPEAPIPILSAEVYGLVWNDDGDVCCYVKNTGDIDIRFYELTFDVDLLYHKPIALIVVLGENLEVGSVVKECIEVECPLCGNHDIVSVSVTYELWK
ncbi:MAG: hypothetical protein Q8M94_15510 [Ignavibacteria bacterium]|nr:hypothetical protein [Ignavibacteria bacterium]